MTLLSWMMTIAGCAALTAALIPIWQTLAHRLNLIDAPGSRKIHERDTPLAGGPAIGTTGLIFLGLLLIPAAREFFHSHLFPLLGTDPSSPWPPPRQILGGVLGAIAMTVLGCFDDRWELQPLPKLLSQLAIVCTTVAFGIRIPPELIPGLPHLVVSIVTVLWLLIALNALNFIDNMNGLCAGLGLISGASFAAWGSRYHQPMTAAVGVFLMGSTLGFLPFNFPRARTFLGDSGSHLIGYWCAVLPLLAMERPTMMPASTRHSWLPVLFIAVPLLDLGWVTLWRWSHRKPIYLGDTNHLSHQLVRWIGLTPALAVATLWLVAAAFAILGWALQ